MARHNLFQIAADNRQTLQNRHTQLLSQIPQKFRPKLDAFEHRIQHDSGISINMTLPKMRGFLDHDLYLSPHQIAEQRARDSGRSIDDELRILQGSYFERRIAFDRAFERGESFLYGALNIGGTGVDTENYGGFCVFFGRAIFDHVDCALVPGNSLDRYMPAATCPELQLDKLSTEIATPPERHQLAALKHHHHVEQQEENQWAAMLCSGDDFIEAIFVGALKPRQISTVRLSPNTVKRYTDLTIDALLGRLDQPEALADLETYKNCVERLRELGYTLQQA